MPSERATFLQIRRHQRNTHGCLTDTDAGRPAEDQQQLPKGGPRIIPDIPMDLPQSPLTTGQVTPYSRGWRTPGHGGIWGNPTQTISDQVPGKRRDGGSLPRVKASRQDIP